MGLLSDKTLLNWYEPRAIRNALRASTNKQRRLYEKLIYRLFYALPFVALVIIKALAAFYKKGKLAMSWPKAVLVALFAGIFITYIIDLILWLVPREIRVMKQAILRNKGQAWDSWKWEDIQSIDIAKTEFAGKLVRVMMLHLVQPSSKTSPEIIGIANKVSEHELIKLIRENNTEVNVISEEHPRVKAD